MRGALITLCAVVACLVVVGTASAEESVAGHLDVSIASNAQFTDYTSSGQRLQYVVLQDWQANRMRELKAANPNLKVLVYKNLLASQTLAPNGFSATGVSYEEADSAHPDWFLQNTDGQRFTLRDYAYQWAMDVGSPGYQQRWAENVVADVPIHHDAAVEFGDLSVERDLRPLRDDPARRAESLSDVAAEQLAESERAGEHHRGEHRGAPIATKIAQH